jgi:sortase (surface protein transpeptidase)
MKILRVLAIVSFLAGITLLVVGFASSGGSGTNQGVSYESSPFPTIDITPTPTSFVPEPTVPGATPTPVPYDGALSRFKIPRFKVDSAVEYIGLKPNNELETPHDPLKTGWYDIEGYGKPGFADNSVFAAHVDYYPNILGPFNKLKDLEKDDAVVVVMDNGTEYTYHVIRKARYDVKTIPMGDLIWPKDRPEGKEWITLITCGGEFVPSRPGGPGEYLNRDVVVAERVR